MATNHVEGKVIAVTGSGSGFGRLVCIKTAAKGAKVLAIDINEEGLKVTEEEVKKAGGTIITREADVTDLAALKAAFADAVKEYGSLDVVVNNAGIMPLAFYSDHANAMEGWSKCIDINIKGVLHGIVAGYDQMIKQGRGHVINLSSIYGNFPVVGAGVYGASKSAVNFLSESLRVESQGKIKVTIIKPTGVPGTNLGSAVVNREAITGILGQNTASYLGNSMAMAEGKGEEAWKDSDSVKYLALEPKFIAEAIVMAIDTPWGVALGDITVRAVGDGYIL